MAHFSLAAHLFPCITLEGKNPLKCIFLTVQSEKDDSHDSRLNCVPFYITERGCAYKLFNWFLNGGL